MVQIIGRDPGSAKRIVHSKCGAILEYLSIDVRTLWSGKDYSGGSAGAEGFSCPSCGDDVIVRSW